MRSGWRVRAICTPCSPEDTEMTPNPISSSKCVRSIRVRRVVDHQDYFFLTDVRDAGTWGVGDADPAWRQVGVGVSDTAPEALIRDAGAWGVGDTDPAGVAVHGAGSRGISTLNVEPLPGSLRT